MLSSLSRCRQATTHGLFSLAAAAALATPVTAAAPRADPAPAPAIREHSEPRRADDPASVYAPYAFLVGTWEVAQAGGSPFAITRFSWGPGESYLWLAVALLEGGSEVPHLEGMLLWNAARGDLDMLLALDLQGGRAQEQGTLSVQSDGSVVREITAIRSGAAGDGGATTTRFRQTFRPSTPGRMETSLMRQTENGWEPTFPGSERLVMTRYPAE